MSTSAAFEPHLPHCAGSQLPVITVADARADRANRVHRHATNCVLLAVVTSPDVAADLIDRAINALALD